MGLRKTILLCRQTLLHQFAIMKCNDGRAYPLAVDGLPSETARSESVVGASLDAVDPTLSEEAFQPRSETGVGSQG